MRCPNWWKQTIRFVLHDLGASTLLRTWQRTGIRILCYHRFPEKDVEGFEQQCQYIRQHYRPIPLSAAGPESDDATPARLAVTIDDGYLDFYLNAYPILRKYHIPATVFLVTDFIDRKSWLWWDVIAYAFRHTARQTAEVAFSTGEALRVSLGSEEERGKAIQATGLKLVEVPDRERLEVLSRLPASLGVDLPPLPTQKYAPLSWDAIREMAENGITFGAHTKTHPILSRIGDCGVVRDEIEESKIRIEKEIGRRVVEFCYPNGGRGDYTAEIVQIVRECGFERAVTMELGLNFGQVDPLRLQRIGVAPDYTESHFKEKVDSLWRLAVPRGGEVLTI